MLLNVVPAKSPNDRDDMLPAAVLLLRVFSLCSHSASMKASAQGIAPSYDDEYYQGHNNISAPAWGPCRSAECYR